MKDLAEDLSGWVHGEDAIKQKVRRTVKTRLGSQILNRSFGSKVHRYIDSSLPMAKAYLSGEIFEALSKHVPDFYPKSIEYTSTRDDLNRGRLKLTVIGTWQTRELRVDTIIQ